MKIKKEIKNDKEWVLSLEHILSLYEMIEDNEYVYNNYLDWGSRGSIFEEIEYRRKMIESTNDYITELENKILDKKK